MQKRKSSLQYTTLDRKKFQESIVAPAMGGDSVSPETTVEEIADWIEERDKLPLLLAVSLYSSPILEYAGFRLQQEWSTSVRTGVWFRYETDDWIVGCRGTAITSDGGKQDIADDQKIGFGSYCDLSLVAEGSQIISRILEEGWDREDIIVVGHSLGGAAAICLSTHFGVRAISLNGGAAPTNPVLSGPGPNMAIHYHVFGDLISSHMSPDAARIIRVRNNQCEFGGVYPHAAVRMLKRDGPKEYVDATTEDQAYQKWGKRYHGGFFRSFFGLLGFLATMKKYEVVQKSPIPGSQRWELKRLNSELGH